MSGGGDTEGGGGNRRRAERSSVLKRAQILFGSTVIDCVVVDSSAGGLRIRIQSAIAVPEAVTLRFVDGSAVRARRRWTRGTEVGFRLDVEADLLDAMIAGLTQEQRRALLARVQATLDRGG